MLTVLLAGCGGGSAAETQPAPPATTAATATTIACTAEVEPYGSDELAYGAGALRDLRIYDRPGGRPVERFKKINPNGVPTVFGVVARRVEENCKPSWYRVRLPRRPNGRLGWVRAADVRSARYGRGSSSTSPSGA